MIDRSFGDYGKVLRAPDLKLGDVRSAILTESLPFEHRIEEINRGVFVYAQRGTFLLDIEGVDRPPIIIRQGTAVGFESGRAQKWRAVSEQAAGIGSNETVELFVSSIPRRFSVLQSLEDGLIIVPPDAEPFASVFHHCVQIHLCEIRHPSLDNDDLIIRRCAEICLMQFVRYVQSKVSAQPDAPVGLAHDEYLLRAWSAFFADPRRRWTVQALADAAGLGRTSFSERFHRIFGTPPLQTLTELRLKQAEDMLQHSTAPLIEIAFTVGYNSEAAFVRAFHRKFGTPPGRFRKAHDRS